MLVPRIFLTRALRPVGMLVDASAPSKEVPAGDHICASAEEHNASTGAPATSPTDSTTHYLEHPSVSEPTATSTRLSAQLPSHSSPLEQVSEGPDTSILVAGGFVAFVLLLIGIGWLSGGLTAETLVSLAQWFEALGPLAIVAYAALYFFLELIAVVPATALTLGAGYLFGVAYGTIAVSIASTCAAAAGFLIARYGLRDYVSKIAYKYPKFRALDRAIGREGFRFVFLLRLSPLLPFAISNYLYGLTSVSLRDYTLASWLGMLPGTIAYVSAGAAVNALADIGAHKSTVNPFLIAVGVGATVLALATIAKLASSAIAEAELEEGNP